MVPAPPTLLLHRSMPAASTQPVRWLVLLAAVAAYTAIDALTR